MLNFYSFYAYFMFHLERMIYLEVHEFQVYRRLGMKDAKYKDVDKTRDFNEELSFIYFLNFSIK